MGAARVMIAAVVLACSVAAAAPASAQEAPRAGQRAVVSPGRRSPTMIAVGVGLLALAALTPVGWMIAQTQADVLHDNQSEIIFSSIGAGLCVTAGLPLLVIGAEDSVVVPVGRSRGPVAPGSQGATAMRMLSVRLPL